MKSRIVFVGILVLSTLLVACGGGGDSSGISGSGSYNPGAGNPGGDFGATAGGVQDMNFARDLVNNGKVPPADAFIVEAMYSEHDLPVNSLPCEMTLCIRGSIGIAPDASNKQSGWVHLGLSSNIDPETYVRQPTTIIATVDTSGSMNWASSANSSPIDTAKALLRSINRNLTEADQIAIIGYGTNVYDHMSLTTGGSPLVETNINSLSIAGGTNMEAGLTRAYEVAEAALESSSNVRIILFTDIQPNIGASFPSQFETIALNGANKGIELTVMGIGVGMGSEFIQAMSYMRGANAYSLMDVNDVGGFMADNWPWMVSPIAYDLNVAVTMPAGLTISKTYGFPDSGTSEEISFDVATVFPSKKKGALLLKLAGAEFQNLFVDMNLSYTGADKILYESDLSVAYEGQAVDAYGQYMPERGIAKTVALTLLVTEMKRAAESYQGNPEESIAIMTAALQRFNAYAVFINDPVITYESEFWTKLLVLMETGAEQGNFYGIP